MWISKNTSLANTVCHVVHSTGYLNTIERTQWGIYSVSQRQRLVWWTEIVQGSIATISLRYHSFSAHHTADCHVIIYPIIWKSCCFRNLSSMLILYISNFTLTTQIYTTAILLSTGSEIKIYQYHSDGDHSNQISPRSRLNDDRWITTIDYYYDEHPVKPDTTQHQHRQDNNISLQQATKPPKSLCVLWLDANLNNIYKSTINHTVSDGKMLLPNSSWRRGTPIYVNHQYRLNLGHQRDASTLAATQVIIRDKQQKIGRSVGWSDWLTLH